MKHIKKLTPLIKCIKIKCTQAQSTAEYALIVLGAATLATLFIAWVNDTNRIGKLFDAVLRSVTNLI